MGADKQFLSYLLRLTVLSKALIDVSGDYNTLSDIRLKRFHPYKTVLPGYNN